MKKFFLFTVLALAISAGASGQMLRVAAMKQAPARQRTAAVATLATDVKQMPAQKAPRRAIGDPIDTLYMPPVGGMKTMPFVADGYWQAAYYGLLVPSQIPVVWRNNTGGTGVDETISYNWLYADKFTTGENYSESTDMDLTTTFNGSIQYIYGAPYLFVNNAEEGYQFEAGKTFNYHGGSMIREVEDYGVSTTCWCADIFDDGSDYLLIGAACKNTKNTGSNGWWTTRNKQNGYLDAEVDTVIVMGNMQHIEDPGRAYTISRAQAVAVVQANAGGKVTAKLIGRNSDGLLDLQNPIATADYVFTKAQALGYTLMEFQFETIDDDGLVSIDPIEIEGDCFIMIDFTDAGILEYRPILHEYMEDFMDQHEIIDTNGYTLIQGMKDGEPVETGIINLGGGYYWGSEADGWGYPSNAMIGVDIAYPFIYNEDEELDTINIVVAGESKTIELQSDHMFDDWTLSADKDGNEELPEWLTITGEDEMETYEGEEYPTGKVTVTIAADALPEDMTGRQTEVYFNVPTMSYKITVIQGEAVEPQPSKVYLIGDDPLGGWNPEAPIEMTENEETAGLFTYTVNVEEAKDIYFVFTEGIGSWDEVNGHRYGPTEANQDVVVGEDMTTQLSTNDQAAYKLAAVAGEYTITFNKNTMTFRVDGGVAPEPDYVLHYGHEGVEWQDATFVPGEGENEGKLVVADLAFDANTEFGVKYGETWFAGLPNEGEDNYVIHYGWCTDIPLSTGDNVKNFLINEAGTYTFLLNVGEEGNTLTVNGFTAPALPGDANGDGQVDISDVNSVINQMLGKEAMIPACDMNGDGKIDISDVNAVINKMLGK